MVLSQWVTILLLRLLLGNVRVQARIAEIMRAGAERAEVTVEEVVFSHIHLPLSFTDQLYNLRSHIDIVRKKMTSRASVRGRVAAE